jgi:hypothetical protein
VATVQEIQATMTGFPRALRWDMFTPTQSSRQPPRLAHTSSGYSLAATWSAALIDGAYRVRGLRISVALNAAASWATPAARASASLLRHEQGHYDITGLVARDLAGAILDLALEEVNFTQQTALAEFRGRIAELGQQANDTLRRLQSNGGIQGIYDQQTQHGDNVAAQNRWNSIFDQVKQHNPQSFRLRLAMAGIP